MTKLPIFLGPDGARSQPATRSTHQRVLAVTTDLVAQKARDARSNLRGRECHLLHASHDDPLQRMLNALQPASFIRPHRHPSPGGAESVILLQGVVGIVVFEDDGSFRDDDLIVLDHRTGHLGADIRAGAWHTVVALEPDTVFFEAKAGPYDPDKTEPAPWTPEEGSPEAMEYLDRLVGRFRRILE